MRLLPEFILDRDTPDGERHVRWLLSAAAGSPGGFAVHSLNLPDHAYKRYGEADFVLVDRRGLLVLEVKGGIVCHDGRVWSFANGRGEARKRSEGPHRQAESGVQALLRTLVRSGAPKVGVFGWAVVLPFTYWTKPHPEIPNAVLLDRSACGTAVDFTAALDRAFRWWRERAAVSGRDTGPLDPAALEPFLMPEFKYAPAPARCAEAIERDVVRLTALQAEILEGLSANPRLLVEGGAGTGKTVLASAAARQAAAVGQSVALMIAAPVLAGALAAALPRVTVVSPSEIRSLPSGCLDVLVVDEGQEMANAEGLGEAHRVLRGGLEGGQWRWFMDPTNQALHANVEKDSLGRLRESSTHYRLQRNVRSTLNIVNLVHCTVGADVGVSDIDARGVLPHVQRVAGQADACFEAAVDHVRGWLDDGIDPGEVAILASACDLPVLLDVAHRRLGNEATALVEPSALDAARTRVIVSDPSSFRGMERAWVAVACTQAFAAQPKSDRFLYVAMTRPRAALAIFLADGADRWFGDLQATHATRIEAG
jgi:hypothetical protein